jgi:predicted Holliday junction resolvase-like endonuclease
MTNLDIFVFSSFAIALFLLKSIYDKYTTAKNLLDAFVEEIENLNTLRHKHQEQLDVYADELDEKNQLEFSLKLQQEKKNSELKELKNKISTLLVDLDKQEKKHESDLNIAVVAARKDALKRSRSVIRGQASEHLAPFVVKNTNPKDYRFMGNPIDYICFNGLSDVLDGKSDTIKSVDFVDIKTGKSSLNKSQRRIRDAINSSKVTFTIINLDEVLKNDTIKKEETSDRQED